MNATINGYIDMLFKDTLDTVETISLREELQNNCQEHYNDLIARGLNETEAIDAVIESLNGMKEVIDEYPKKPGAEKKEEPENKVAEEKTDAEEPVKEEVPKDRTFDAAQIRFIESNLRSSDITVAPSTDGMIHVRCEEPDQIICRTVGDKLKISIDSEWEKLSKNGDLKMENFSMKAVMNFVGNILNKVSSDMKKTGIHVFVDLPDGKIEEMCLNSMSGNIEAQDCSANKISMRSTSGDVRMKVRDGQKVNTFLASAASGDIDLTGNADHVEMNSISGDVHMEGDCRKISMKSTSGDDDLEGCAGEVSAHSVSGDIMLRIRNIDVKKIDTASTSGNVEIQLPENIAGVHASMRSVSGRTNCAFPNAQNGEGVQITASTVSGDVRIA